MNDLTLLERQALRDKDYFAKHPDKNALLRHRLYKRYKIRMGSDYWKKLTDKQRTEHLSKFVDHYFRITRIRLTPVVQSAEWRPPYAVSFVGGV